MRGGGEDGGDGEESEEGDGGKWRGEPTVATAGGFFFFLFSNSKCVRAFCSLMMMIKLGFTLEQLQYQAIS